MKRSFFDLLAIANVERIHSAVIAWLLSDDCEALKIEERSRLLHAIFGVPDDKVYRTIEMRLEWKKIDILWLTETATGEKACWALENKIKSGQYDEQLDGSKAKVEEVYGDRMRFYCFLTLIGELASESSEVKLYNNYTYAQLEQELRLYLAEEARRDNSDWVIAHEYFKTIEKMTAVTEDFLSNHMAYPRVFEDGSKSFYEKMEEYKSCNLHENEQYIACNGLETLLQKYYLIHAAKEIEQEHIQCKNFEWWHVGETRGNADIGFHYINYKVSQANKEYHFDISFQAGTFKFAVSYKYDEPEGQDKATRKTFVEEWEPVFQELKEEYKCRLINRGKSRCRISICYPIECDVKWYELPKREFIDLVKKEVVRALKMKERAIELYEEAAKTLS